MRKTLLFLLFFALPALAFGQQVCYLPDPNHPGMNIWNPACGQTPPNPWQIAAGKTVSFLNTLSFKGLDNQTIDFSKLGQGAVQLQSAALQQATDFQPAGAGANASTYYPGSLTIGTGANNGGNGGITITTGLSFSTSMGVAFIQASNSNEWMYGTVSSYDITTGAYNVNVTSSNGSGTYSGWQISVSGVPGPIGQTGSGSAPVGSLELFAGSSIPANYLACDGTAYSRTTYAGLYGVIGTSWGAGDGSTTFNVPDFRGRFPVGAGQGSTHEGGGTGTNRVLAATGGAETHTQWEAEIAPHSHGGVTSTETVSHQHDVTVTGGIQPGGVSQFIHTGDGSTGTWYYTTATSSGTTGSENQQHTHFIANDGLGLAMTIMNPFAVVNYIIRYQ